MINWLLSNLLWLAGFGLMLASSGIDGAYMSDWMPDGFGWLGYVLNTTADVSGMILTYNFGRLQQDRTKAKRKLSLFLLGAEVIAVVYSWFFSWRQLLLILPAIEPLAYKWVAPVAAGFIPLLLAFIGYAEALIAGRFEATDAKTSATGTTAATTGAPVKTKPEPREITLNQWRAISAKMNGDTPTDVDTLNQWLAANGYRRKPASTARRWLKESAHNGAH